MPSEETVKKKWANNFGQNFDYLPGIGKIDVVLVSKKTGYDIAWIETKPRPTDCWQMAAQIVLTAKREVDNGKMPPVLLGAYDTDACYFIPFNYCSTLLAEHNVDWTDDASKPSSKTQETVKKHLDEKITKFAPDDFRSIEEYFTKIAHSPEGKIDITVYNFVQVFNHWNEDVYPSISLTPPFEQNNVKPADFFLADLMLAGNRTLFQKLRLYLEHQYYKFVVAPQETLALVAQCTYKDGGSAYKTFWNAYKRPPAKEWQNEILTRRDLLVPLTFRVKTGAFFTPHQWADKALDYFALSFGDNWQDVYAVWDCAAGTGNLLDGLSNQRNIFASTLEHEDVQTVKEMGKLFENNVFQFDFLNDDFVPISEGGKIPDVLYKIATETPKNIVFFINPPYLQDSDGRGTRSSNTATANRIKSEMQSSKINATDFINQFLYRIKRDFPKGKLGIFCKPKFITGNQAVSIRKYFTAFFKGGFAVPSYTFDNVNGHFPITFTIWDLDNTTAIEKIAATVDVFDEHNQPQGTKTFYATDYPRITKWVKKAAMPQYGGFYSITNAFTHQPYYHLKDNSDRSDFIPIDNSNLIPLSTAYTAIMAIPAGWLNDRDQFFAPRCSWKTDIEFQNDCLILTAFHQKNYAHHWIPFTEKDVKSPVQFANDDFVKFLKQRLKETEKLSSEALAVFESAKAMWKYAYTAGNLREENPRHCDIALPFLEPNKKRAKIIDAEFAKLNDDFIAKRKVLNDKIIPKIYEHGFLSILPPTGIPDIGNGFFGRE